MTAISKFTTVEGKLFLREPMTWVIAIVLPTAILVILGSILGTGDPDPALGGQRFIDVFIPSLVVITLATLSVNTFTVRLATYREKGVLRRLSTAPVAPATVLVAQGIVNVIAAILAIALLVVVGHVLFAVPLPRDPVGFLLAFGLGMSSLFAIALAIAAVVPTASAASSVGLPVFFAVMFLGGVYLPRFMLPDLIVQIGNLTPPGVQGLQDAWLGAPLQILPLAIMGTITVVAGAIAIRTFRWE